MNKIAQIKNIINKTLNDMKDAKIVSISFCFGITDLIIQINTNRTRTSLEVASLIQFNLITGINENKGIANTPINCSILTTTEIKINSERITFNPDHEPIQFYTFIRLNKSAFRDKEFKYIFPHFLQKIEKNFEDCPVILHWNPSSFSLLIQYAGKSYTELDKKLNKLDKIKIKPKGWIAETSTYIAYAMKSIKNKKGQEELILSPRNNCLNNEKLNAIIQVKKINEEEWDFDYLKDIQIFNKKNLEKDQKKQKGNWMYRMGWFDLLQISNIESIYDLASEIMSFRNNDLLSNRVQTSTIISRIKGE
ncbi:MAG: hypothetical protein GF308_07430 [Candidatus Heimdallarchaeota archaeon]|nr:hypothetical protein [Candidatus Heimdallarchaeota archaeon]